MSKKTGLKQFAGAGENVISIDLNKINNTPVSNVTELIVPTPARLTIQEAFAMLRTREGTNLTADQIRGLVGLNYSDGSPIFNLDTTKGISAITEIGALLRVSPYSDVVSYITNLRPSKYEDIIWTIPSIVVLTQRVEHIQDLETKVEASELLGHCKKCGCTKIYYSIIQLSRADEGFTEKYRCAACSATGAFIKIN